MDILHAIKTLDEFREKKTPYNEEVSEALIMAVNALKKQNVLSDYQGGCYIAKSQNRYGLCCQDNKRADIRDFLIHEAIC